MNECALRVRCTTLVVLRHVVFGKREQRTALRCSSKSSALSRTGSSPLEGASSAVSSSNVRRFLSGLLPLASSFLRLLLRWSSSGALSRLEGLEVPDRERVRRDLVVRLRFSRSRSRSRSRSLFSRSFFCSRSRSRVSLSRTSLSRSRSLSRS